MRMLVFSLCTLVLLGITPPARSTVTVLYAGSLVTPMEGPISERLSQQLGMRFLGEGRGSKALYNLIRDGLRSPDVFISADQRLVDDLPARGLVASSVRFGSASMVLGYSSTSAYLARFAAAASGKRSIASVLKTPGLRIGRTDPALDPKGLRTVKALGMLGLAPTLGDIYPEEDLLVRLETGALDAGFLYSTEAIARHIPAIALPGKASLSGDITYTLAVMKAAPHPEAARRFADFILTGEGRRILESAGVTFI